ncbi:hypothetical protein BD410DRAFT_845373 [Rickenella mellea]|uniref:Uncharacterized protein n=1 Tax=Rickenella mellea TaxID=50990 RepID=A0A4Y7PIN5_9AGAM|nr:hypothetical protein BD410DRAFT_845373 [Rickenella mellea]
MPRGPTTYWEIYDAQLSHIGRGVALWHPGPYEGDDGQFTPIRLGDVGYMLQGRFVALFNASEASAPNPCEPYPASKLLDVVPCRSFEESFTSKSVKATVVDLDVADPESMNIQVSAKLTCEKEAGAALLLPGRKRPKFHSLNLKHKTEYGEYCFRHCEEWLKASDSAAKDIELKDLIFVTGIDNVYAWSLFSFQRQSRSCAFKLAAGQSTVSGALDIRSSSIDSPMTNFGPADRPRDEEPSAPDQTVFVRRFKIHRRVDRLKWRMMNYMKHGGGGGAGNNAQVDTSRRRVRISTAAANGSGATARPTSGRGRASSSSSGATGTDGTSSSVVSAGPSTGGGSDGSETSPLLARTEVHNLIASGSGSGGGGEGGELASPTSPTSQGSPTDAPTTPFVTSPSSTLFSGPSHESTLTPDTPISPTRTDEPLTLLVVPTTSPMDHYGRDGSDVEGSVVGETEAAEVAGQKEKKKRVHARERGVSFADDRGGSIHRRGGGPGAGGAGGTGSNGGGSAGGAGGGAGTGQGGGGPASNSRLPTNSGHHYQGPRGGGGQTRAYSRTGKEPMKESDGSDALGEDADSEEECDEYSDESGSDLLDSEPLDPLDALLEYMLEVCPDAKYSCTSDDDLLQFKDYLSADWLAFPALLRELKPKIALRPDGRVAVIIQAPEPPSIMEEQEEEESSPMPTSSSATTSSSSSPRSLISARTSVSSARTSVSSVRTSVSSARTSFSSARTSLSSAGTSLGTLSDTSTKVDWLRPRRPKPISRPSSRFRDAIHASARLSNAGDEALLDVPKFPRRPTHRLRSSGYDELGGKPRIENSVGMGSESSHPSSSNLLSRDLDAMVTPVRQTLIVREEGQSPMHFVSVWL